MSNVHFYPKTSYNEKEKRNLWRTYYLTLNKAIFHKTNKQTYKTLPDILCISITSYWNVTISERIDWHNSNNYFFKILLRYTKSKSNYIKS